MINKTNRYFAFTLAEVMITLMVISVILSVLFVTTKHLVDNYKHRYLYYSAFNNIKTAVSEMKADGCTKDEGNILLDDAVCTSMTSIPFTAHNNNNRGFCDRLADYFNKTGTANCSTATKDNYTTLNDFSTAIPNFVATNGMAFYNLGEDSGGSQYSVYVDIDGTNSGKGILDNDVFKFVVTLNGVTLPDNNSIAAKNTDYLSVSAYYPSDDGHKVYVDENKSFYYTYCDSQNTLLGYCTNKPKNADGDPTGTPLNSDCTTHICQMEINKPAFFWAK